MGKRCAHGLCNSDSRYDDRPHMEGVRFIKFPKPWEDMEKCKMWVHLCGRQNFTIYNVTKDTYICSKHFVDSNGPSKDYPHPISALKEGKPLFTRKRVLRSHTYVPERKKKKSVVETGNEHEPLEIPSTEDVSTVDLPYEPDEPLEIPSTEDVSSVDLPKQCRKDGQTQTGTWTVTSGTQTLGEPYVRRLFSNPVVEQHRLFSYEVLKNQPSSWFKFWTGISLEHFQLLLDLVGLEKCKTLKYTRKQISPVKAFKGRKLTTEDRFLILLMRLRRGLTEKELAYLFSVSQTTVSTSVSVWIRFLYLEFKKYDSIMFHTKLDKKIPQCYRHFKNLKVILDGTEILIEMPSDFTQQGDTYSSYKSSNTVKFLVGINVYGGISYVSEGFEGAISDREIFKQCSIFKFLKRGDVIMADRGFTIQDILFPLGIQIIIPPFLKGRNKLTAREEMETKNIARSRIHVERAIGRIKNYRILKHPMKLSLLPLLSQMFFIVCFLVNFETPYV